MAWRQRQSAERERGETEQGLTHLVSEASHLAFSNSPLKHEAAATAAKSLQSCPTLCDPIDSSPPGSSVPGILQARTLE